MKWLVLFGLFASGMEAAQTAPSFDPVELLLKVRQKVVPMVARVPSYVCTETLTRSQFIPTLGLTDIPRFPERHGEQALDASPSCDYLAKLRKSPSWGTRQTQVNQLQFDVAVSDTNEMYSLAGGSRFHADAPAGLSGASPTSLASFAKTIFVGDGASFTNNGETTLKGRPLVEFGYSVSAEKSRYSIDTQMLNGLTGQSETYSAIVPYAGVLLVDPQTSDLVRLTVQPNPLPKELKMCETSTSIDYAKVRMNNSEFLLPKAAVLHDDKDNATEDEEKAGFSGCHEAGAEPASSSATSTGLSNEDAAHVPGTPRLEPKQEEQLLAIRQKVMATLERLPNYLCTQTTDRLTLLPKASVDPRTSCRDVTRLRSEPNWKVVTSQSDRLRLDVAASRHGGEMYSWAGENKFNDRSLADIAGSGATSTGTFGDLLGAIFEGDAASFTYQGMRESDGRTVVQFGFRVPLHKSALTITNKSDGSTVPYAGEFLADPKTFRLVRLVVRSDGLPKELHACGDSISVDYSEMHLNDAQVLVPQKALFKVYNDDGSEYENRTVFSSCHEFLTGSTLHFDSPAPVETEEQRKPAAQAFTMPAGLHFMLALTRPIETKTAAAGDTITARLSAPLMGKHRRVFYPKGAIVTGRIVKIVRLYQPSSLTVAIRLETIQSAGIKLPFPARLDPVITHVDGAARQVGWCDSELSSPSNGDCVTGHHLGSFNQMPQLDNANAGILRFEGVTVDYVIHQGLQLEGTTAAQ